MPDLSLWFGAIVVVGSAVLGTLGLVFLLRSGGGHKIPGSHDPEGVYVTTLGTLYAIFLAFMIFAVWTRFYEALQAVETEANDVTDLYRLAEGLPPQLRDEIQSFCRRYADIVVKKEWDAMARGSEQSPSRSLVRHQWGILARMNSGAAVDPVLRDHILGRWMELTDLRRSRLLQSRIALPGLLYAVLVLGAAVTVAAAAIFPAEDLLLHCLKACLLAVLISLMLYAVVSIDRPFQGPVRVTPAPFERTQQIVGD